MKGLHHNVDELAFTIACLHIAFVCLMFGNQPHWHTYSTVLGVGLMACSATAHWQRVPTIVLAVAAFVPFLVATRNDLRARGTLMRSAASMNLWVPREFDREWKHALALSSDKKTMVLSEGGAAGLLIPQLESPTVGLGFYPGLVLPLEMSRYLSKLPEEQIVIIVSAYGVPSSILNNYPVVGDALKNRSILFIGQHMEVFGCPFRLRQRQP